MSTSIFSRKELNAILQALVNKVKSMNNGNFQTSDFADYHSAYYKISSLIDRCTLDEHYEFFLKGIDSEIKRKKEELLETRISDSDLDIRAINILRANDINYVKELVALNPKTLKSMRSVGNRCMFLIQDFMEANKLEFETNAEEPPEN